MMLRAIRWRGVAGVSVRSLRYYEEQGLLAPTRSSSGQRHYLEADVERARAMAESSPSPP